MVASHVRRGAVADESGSAVLALGGPPTFTPSASEWIERARPLIRTDPRRAAEIIDEMRTVEIDGAALRVAEALLAVGRGDRQSAADMIGELLRERPHPDLRHTLEQDPDLGPLMDRP